MRRKYNTALRKIRKLSKNKVHFEHIVGKFLNHDQLSALCKISTRGSKYNIKQIVVGEICDQTSDIAFPDCHNIKIKLLNRFVGARLQFFAKKQRTLISETVVKKSGHELSSKSMQMRKSVSKIK